MVTHFSLFVAHRVHAIVFTVWAFCMWYYKNNNKPICFVCFLELALLKTKEPIGFVCFLDAIFQNSTDNYWFCCCCSDCLDSKIKKPFGVVCFLAVGLQKTNNTLAKQKKKAHRAIQKKKRRYENILAHY